MTQTLKTLVTIYLSQTRPHSLPVAESRMRANSLSRVACYWAVLRFGLLKLSLVLDHYSIFRFQLHFIGFKAVMVVAKIIHII